MDGTHFLTGAKIGSAKMLFPIIVLNPTGAENNELTENFQDMFELGACYLVFNALLGYYNMRKEKQLLAKWRENQLPLLLQKHDQAIEMIKKRAKDVQKRVRDKNGVVIMRAYYGMKADILRFIDFTHFNSLYWEEDETRLSEHLGNLMMLNVTVPVRLNLNDKMGEKGGLLLGSG